MIQRAGEEVGQPTFLKRLPTPCLMKMAAVLMLICACAFLLLNSLRTSHAQLPLSTSPGFFSIQCINPPIKDSSPFQVEELSCLRPPPDILDINVVRQFHRVGTLRTVTYTVTITDPYPNFFTKTVTVTINIINMMSGAQLRTVTGGSLQKGSTIYWNGDISPTSSHQIIYVLESHEPICRQDKMKIEIDENRFFPQHDRRPIDHIISMDIEPPEFCLYLPFVRK